MRLGLIDISGLTKAQAVAALKDSVDTKKLTPREAAAIALVDRIIVDPAVSFWSCRAQGLAMQNFKPTTLCFLSREGVERCTHTAF